MRRIAITVLVLALLAGTTAAFGLTQALKLRRSPVTAPVFDKLFAPTCDCPTNEAQLALRLRKADRIDAVIVDSDGEAVRSLASRLERPKGLVHFSWDGRDERGAVVPDGRYRLRIHLYDNRRTIVIPNTVTVDATRPVAELVSVDRPVFSPDRDGRNDKLKVRYRSSEPAAAALLANGVVGARGRLHRAGTARVRWAGIVDGERVPAGTYAITIELTDRAGNVSAPTKPIRVRLRYIELVTTGIRVSRAGTLRIAVDTDARSFRWTLSRRTLPGLRGRVVLRGTARGRETLVALPVRVRPGRYVLLVAANGFGDTTQLTIVRRTR